VSFFDDEDDAIEEEPRRSPRAPASARPRSGSASPRTATRVGGGGPRRPGADPAVERRRWVAGGILIVVVILVILLISSCQARNTKNSLEDYNNSVFSLVNKSDATGRQVFSILSSGKGGSVIATNLAGPVQDSLAQLKQAKDLSVPGQMSSAQQHVVLAMQMRADGISTIAKNVGQITSSGAATTQAVKNIAAGTARFYASDVTYKGYAAPEIAGALHGDNIAVGGDSNIQINSGQFLTDLGWLEPTFIATKLGTTVTTGSGSSGSAAGQNSTAAGLHGDALVSTAVGSNTLSTSGTNTVAGSPAPTFTLSVSNGGTFDQFGISCTVSVSGGPTGKSSISETTPGNTSTCNVTLNGTVPAGTYQVTVTIGKVPGETNLTNNSSTYSVDFQ
jgi:hypothetical protein